MRLKARHWGGVALIAGLLAVTGWLVGQQRVGIPLLIERIPIRALLPGVSATLAAYPLLDWYPGFSEILVRERPLRRWRVLAATAIFVVAVSPGIITGTAGPTIAGELVVSLGFLALGLASVVVLGDLAWLVVLTATFSVLFLNTPPVEPLTRAAAAPAAFALAATLYAAAAVLYVRLGPRTRRLSL